MSIEKMKRSSGEIVWRVRWRQHGRNRARTFSTRRDAADFDTEVRRQRRAGSLTALDAGTETLAEYVIDTWAATHAAALAPKTRLHYASLYDHHLRPHLGSIMLREIGSETIGRWQADRLAAGAGPTAVRQALDLLGSVLEHAFVAGRIAENPVRRVKKARRPRREEVQRSRRRRSRRCVRRSALGTRRLFLCSPTRVFVPARRPACGGETSGSAPSLSSGQSRWARRPIQRRVSIEPSACSHHWSWICARGVLQPGARMTTSSSSPARTGSRGHRRRINLGAVGRSGARRTPRGSPTHVRTTCGTAFASLLLHEGRSVIYVARQHGHDARLTLTRYGHVIDELDDAPRLEAEAAIADARLAARTTNSDSVREFGS